MELLWCTNTLFPELLHLLALSDGTLSECGAVLPQVTRHWAGQSISIMFKYFPRLEDGLRSTWHKLFSQLILPLLAGDRSLDGTQAESLLLHLLTVSK